jgi:hypothetical protein
MARGFDNASTRYLTMATAVATALRLSVSCWVNTSTTSNREIFSITQAGTNNEAFRLNVQSQKVAAATRTGGLEQKALSASTYSTTDDFHVGATWVATNDRNVFLDGTKSQNTNTRATPTGLDTTTIGAFNGSSIVNPFDGNIWDVAVWDTDLTDAEMVMLAAGESPLRVRPASLVAYWPLIGKHSPEIDIIGGVDMTLTNAPTTQPHGRLFAARGRRLFGIPAAAGGGGATVPIFNHHYRTSRAA